MWQIVAKDSQAYTMEASEVVSQLASGLENLSAREDIRELVARVLSVAQESGDLSSMSPSAVAELSFALGYRYKAMLIRNPTKYNGEPVGQKPT
jgi:hypothetical protein